MTEKFELTVYNEDGTVKTIKTYKNIVKMSEDTKISYNILRKIMKNNNNIEQKYKETEISNILKKVKINKIITELNL